MNEPCAGWVCPAPCCEIHQPFEVGCEKCKGWRSQGTEIRHTQLCRLMADILKGGAVTTNTQDPLVSGGQGWTGKSVTMSAMVVGWYLLLAVGLLIWSLLR